MSQVDSRDDRTTMFRWLALSQALLAGGMVPPAGGVIFTLGDDAMAIEATVEFEESTFESFVQDYCRYALTEDPTVGDAIGEKVRELIDDGLKDRNLDISEWEDRFDEIEKRVGEFEDATDTIESMSNHIDRLANDVERLEEHDLSDEIDELKRRVNDLEYGPDEEAVSNIVLEAIRNPCSIGEEAIQSAVSTAILELLCDDDEFRDAVRDALIGPSLRERIRARFVRLRDWSRKRYGALNDRLIPLLSRAR